MKFCTFLWKKTATQKIFCIAVMQKCIANCDAIPGKLFPDKAYKIQSKYMVRTTKKQIAYK